MGKKLRLRFSKTGTAKYISHLDLMATMRRGLLRACVGLKYSEGFNPHPYMSAALPLPVGMGSVCELMDIGVEEDYSPPADSPARFTAAMPGGIEILGVYAPGRKFADIAWIGIRGSLVYDAPPPEIVNRLAGRYAEDGIVISKKTKRGVSDVDIAPLFRDIEFTSPDVQGNESEGSREIVVKALISAQEPPLSPGNLLSALSGEYAELAPDHAAFTRLALYDKEMSLYV